MVKYVDEKDRLILGWEELDQLIAKLCFYIDAPRQDLKALKTHFKRGLEPYRTKFTKVPVNNERKRMSADERRNIRRRNIR